jgi:hypothetical protein
MLTFNGRGFTRHAAVDPSMTNSRRRAVTEFEATMDGLTAILGQPDTEPGKYPCWLIDADGAVVSVYYLGLDPYEAPAAEFTFSVGAERGHTATADAVVDVIVMILNAPEV